MNFDNFTIKSQEVIQKAVEICRTNNQQAIEPVHLLKAIMDEGETVVKFIFQKLGVNANLLETEVDKSIVALPKVSGGNSEPYLSRESNDALQRAIDYSKKAGDEYVTVETLLMGIYLSVNNASTLLKTAGVSEKELATAIAE